MRKGEMPNITTQAHWEAFERSWAGSHCNDHPGYVLAAVDKLLAKIGLEIETVDMKDDTFWFRIVKK